MTVADITVQNVADYLRLSELSAADTAFLGSALSIAKAFIKDYTGQTEEFVNASETFVAVEYVLCQDMYDTRALYVDKTNLNKLVDTILGMYAINLL